MPIKSFRGMIKDGNTDTIRLSTNDGSTGYRIVKFHVMCEDPLTANNESVMHIWKVPGQTPSTSVDFSNNVLLGVGLWSNRDDSTYYPNEENIIFDNEIFNQDIYITHKSDIANRNCNYYLELEQIKLDLSENTVATLKDIRNIASQ